MPAHGVPKFLSASHSNDSSLNFIGNSWRRDDEDGGVDINDAEAGALSSSSTSASLWNGPFATMLVCCVLGVFVLFIFGLLWHKRNNLYVIMPWHR